VKFFENPADNHKPGARSDRQVKGTKMDKLASAARMASSAEFADGRAEIGFLPRNNQVKFPPLFADIYMDRIER